MDQLRVPSYVRICIDKASISLTIKQLPRMYRQLLNNPYQNMLQSVKIHTSAHSQKSFKSWYQNLWIPRKTEPPYCHITQIGDPVLRQKSVEVPLDAIKSKELNLFIDQLIGVLRSYKSVGIAAPQLGIGLRVIAMEFTDRMREEFSVEAYKTRQMEVMPLTVMINPELMVTNYNKKTFVEACASVRGYSADVPRYEEVKLQGLNRKGEQQTLQLKGWNARIAQHEMDHLNGIIYTDIMNRQSFACSCWHTVNVREGMVNIPFGPK